MTPRCTQAPTGRAAQAAARHRAPLPRLETERCVLRAPELTDLPLWTQVFTGPDSTHIGGPYTPEKAWEEFSYYTACWLLHGHGLWSVTRKTDDALLGFVHLGLEWDDLEPELGWLFGPDHRGQGYATEAAAAARDHALALLGAGRFVSYIDQDNAPSLAVAQRLGAHPEPDLIEGDTVVYRHGGTA
ncbi:GNAT family N-acetyltransferase [Aestuariibius sp. 2305UL40-4]|uniref:GNAT family N-acetyltransferase n=1 Tax=Aestuariibius violaceus TaxID=3234132 RepID=UPI00345ED1B1